jgi:hypothetical protein
VSKRVEDQLQTAVADFVVPAQLFDDLLKGW